MSLKSGSNLGSYEIVAPLGAGGMGEVHSRQANLWVSVADRMTGKPETGAGFLGNFRLADDTPGMS